jgi:uncharacterized membrane protein
MKQVIQVERQSEVPKFSLEDYLHERIYRRTLQLYYGVLFMMFVYMTPLFLFFVLMIIGLVMKWSLITLGLVIGISCCSFIVLVAIYHSIQSKRYLGFLCVSSLYVTPNDVYSIEWLPSEIKSEPIQIGDRTYYFNEVVCHPDSDLPYLIVITDAPFDVSGGSMLKSHRDFKFYKGVKCPISLAFSTLVELRCVDLGVYPIEELEEKIPVPVTYMCDGWYFHERMLKAMGRIGLPDNPELLAKALKVFDELHAREYKEKVELLEKRIEELQNIRKDYLAMARESFKWFISQQKLFGRAREVEVSRWSKMSRRKKIAVAVLLILAVIFGIILILCAISH